MGDILGMETRVLNLEGGHNFREIGAYRSRDGRTIKRGSVWRSAALNLLTLADRNKIAELGIRLIVDLRTEVERELHPSADSLSCERLTWRDSEGIARQSFTSELVADWARKSLSEIKEAIRLLYAGIAYTHAAQLRDAFRTVSAGGVPVLIHCTAGKDRTGIACALLLELLEIERDGVLHDYELTNQHIRKEMFQPEALIGLGAFADLVNHVDNDVRDALVGADASYLRAALADIEERHGSTIAFVQTTLGLTESEIEALRDALLE